MLLKQTQTPVAIFSGAGQGVSRKRASIFDLRAF